MYAHCLLIILIRYYERIVDLSAAEVEKRYGLCKSTAFKLKNEARKWKIKKEKFERDQAEMETAVPDAMTAAETAAATAHVGYDKIDA